MSKLSTNKKLIIFCILAIVAIVAMLFHKGETPEQRDRGVTTNVEHRDSVEVTGGAISSGVSNETQVVEKKEKSDSQKEKPKQTSEPVKKKKKHAERKEKLGSAVKKNVVTKPKDSSVSKRENEVVEKKDNIPATIMPQEEGKEYCDVRITCQEVFSHMDLLKENVEQVIPKDGIIFDGKMEVEKNETVFDVLKRVCSEKNISLDYQYTPAYQTYYVKGIHNLYEFDCGDESGWMYRVNDVVPNVGCSSYTVKAGDQITFYYTCEYNE